MLNSPLVCELHRGLPSFFIFHPLFSSCSNPQNNYHKRAFCLIFLPPSLPLPASPCPFPHLLSPFPAFPPCSLPFPLKSSFSIHPSLSPFCALCYPYLFSVKHSMTHTFTVTGWSFMDTLPPCVYLYLSLEATQYTILYHCIYQC